MSSGEVNSYTVKAKLLSGSNYREVYKNAMVIYGVIKRQTKRKPYIRSAYFDKQKVYFDYFWQHLLQKNYKDRVRRLKFFAAGVELIRKSNNHPDKRKINNNEVFRFYGEIKTSKNFVVQLKKNNLGFHFMSCFAWE